MYMEISINFSSFRNSRKSLVNTMSKLRTIDEINIRITQIEQKLDKINLELDKQVQKPFFQRDRNTCLFLHVEKKRYTAILLELKWFISE